MKSTARFSVDPRLSALLGESYTSSERALRELVDNAWDAEARVVKITLPDILSEEPVVIEDDGHGMKNQEVRQEYLKIASPRFSRKGERTPNLDRKVKGRRGIGKFSGLTIGDEMEVVTRAQGVKTTLLISKELLLAAGKDIEEVDLPISEKPYETYRANEILAPLVRELPWSSHLLIMGRSQEDEEREFYLRLAIQEKWTRRTLQRQIDSALFERKILAPAKLAPMVRELHSNAESIFKDSYLVDFLGLPPDHSEADLHQGLIRHLSHFLTELGRDFCFVGSEHPLQVGNQDFALDLLFYHRELNCLVAIELKITAFDPAHLGQLNFYLEALDRDVRKPHENPSIGILLCASKDDEVVEYALSRSLSPALVAEYQTKLPDKALLQAKLHEFMNLEVRSEK